MRRLFFLRGRQAVLALMLATAAAMLGVSPALAATLKADCGVSI